jgi:hypothetical protein
MLLQSNSPRAPKVGNTGKHAEGVHLEVGYEWQLGKLKRDEEGVSCATPHHCYVRSSRAT